MRAFPYIFHLGPLSVRTYGVGLALTFFFGAWYMARRFRSHGLPHEWIGEDALWIVLVSLLGARLLEVLSNLSYYGAHPSEIPMVWHGGLSSFGGLLFGVTFGIWRMRTHRLGVGVGEGLDVAAPVLAASWALGRLVACQFMFQGGGRATSGWYGIEYWGQVGKRIPAPLIQSAESLAIFAALLFIVRRWTRRPCGAIAAIAAIMWGLERLSDQLLWLGAPGRLDPADLGATLVAAAGLVGLAFALHRRIPLGEVPAVIDSQAEI